MRIGLRTLKPGTRHDRRCYTAPVPAPGTVLPPATSPARPGLEEYPCSDGRVLMETDPHANSIVAIRNQLQWHFESHSDAYVAGSMALYYREGDRSAVLAPDVFVALGVAKRARRSYRIWDEGGVVPAFVVEVASPSTSRLDAMGKRATYEQMGVSEYWRFDPLGERIAEGLVGWRQEAGCYQRVRGQNSAGWYRSEVLGLELRAEGWLLRFRDPQHGRELLTHAETSRALHISEHERARAERKAEIEAEARRAAERERDEAARERDEANQQIRELKAKLRLSDESG